MKKILLKSSLKALCPGTFMNIYPKGTGYHLLASGTFTDTEIHKAAGLAQITDYKTVESKP